jgi:EpsI family protein
MINRALVVVALMIATIGLLARAERMEDVPIREALAFLPMQIDDWRGVRSPDFDKKILDVLGVDDYVTRVYYRPGQSGLGLYVGYYQSQREGDTMHSPLNCLPGAGWLPVSQSRTKIQVKDGESTREIEVNDFVIEKGLDRQAVLYWYQSHGRVVASEYWGKVYTVVDAMRYNRSDGSLVRVVAPVAGQGPEALEAARRQAVEFVQALFPLLGRHLPS